MLPKDIASKFKVSWMPILKLMTSVCNNLPASATGQALDALYKQGLEQVRNSASYIFAEGRYEYTTWALSTWSHMIIPSAISKHGTEADKARLGRIPVPHQHKRKRKVSINNNTIARPTQQQQIIPASAQQRLNLAPAQEVAPVLGDRRPTSRGFGCCAIQGCAHAVLNHDHFFSITECPYYVHNMCAQDHNLLDDDNDLRMYCSSTCKEQG
jgi:hypothetical protein